MNVGQGDGAVLISPGGQIVLFDSGVRNNCDLPLAYLQQLGVTAVDYHIASHYHDDHIGCADTVLAAFPVRRAAVDRGATYTTATYRRYEARVRPVRVTATPGMTITLDSGSTHPVVLTVAVVNGITAYGDTFPTNNENDRSVLVWVRFGLFDALIGGDLSGARTSSYRDIETPAAPRMGPVEVYKVHHHGSTHSTNAAWLAAITPMVGIISAGLNNTHHHPTADAMARLHTAGVRTYWTTTGGGVAPVAGRDQVGGDIIVEVTPAGTTFTVTYSGVLVDTYAMWEAPADAAEPAYAWSTRSDVYHHAQCVYVRSISPANLARADTPPAGKRLHVDCPR